MVASLQEVAALFFDEVDEAMFLRDSARPYARTEAFQRLRFAFASERIAYHGFDQAKDPQSNLSILLDPVC